MVLGWQAPIWIQYNGYMVKWDMALISQQQLHKNKHKINWIECLSWRKEHDKHDGEDITEDYCHA